jgi:hypothetical protein
LQIKNYRNELDIFDQKEIVPLANGELEGSEKGVRQVISPFFGKSVQIAFLCEPLIIDISN